MGKIVHTEILTDDQLITAYKDEKGDLSEIYRRYANLVFGSCLKYLKNKTDADDAVSEIFMLISQKLKTHDVDHFKSWLYTVTRNHCIEKLRKVNRHREKKNTAEIMYSEAVFHPDDVEDPEMMKKLADCMEQLPERQQMTIRQFYFDKIAYKDIAVQLGISWDKVRSYMQNGRRNLKNCLEEKLIS